MPVPSCYALWSEAIRSKHPVAQARYTVSLPNAETKLVDIIVKHDNIGYPARKLQLSQALFYDEGNRRRDVKQEVEVLAGSFAAFPAECRSKKWFKGNGSDDDDELDEEGADGSEEGKIWEEDEWEAGNT
ncbi:hypothetical protein FIBSPDRAFT_885097 [Athelia psychrophila]|uniref:Uncharacterized protein n=1 Tax=Athelia psychrophila TaxID=1759441 RepID=A0A166SE02_9AGAM|nr:hypothetical protein FIBSPDRAFT_885097 [Fibularhizoctonia sp. CBS 109695]